MRASTADKARLERERNDLLRQMEDWLELPVLLLGFVWLALLIVELVWGLSPWLDTAMTVIWGVFVADFALRFTLAPHKVAYLKANWLTAMSLFMPALRVLRLTRMAYLLRVTRVTRGLRLVRVVGSLNRGMRALRRSMRRRGFAYVITLTLVVTFVGAAGMYTFERRAGDSNGLNTYGESLWWTAMIMTTMGSQYWPVTAEGRLLCFLLALYSFAVFGYMTAALATFFIGRDADDEQAEIASAKAIERLRDDIAALRDEVRALREA